MISVWENIVMAVGIGAAIAGWGSSWKGYNTAQTIQLALSSIGGAIVFCILVLWFLR